MQIFRREQLYKNRFKADILDVLLVLWTFSSALLSLVLYFFNIRSSSGQLAIIYVIVAAVSAFFCFRNFSRMIPAGFLSIVSLFVFIGFSFLFTNARFGASESKFVSEFKAYFAMAICTILLTLLIAWRKKKDISLFVVFIVIIALTLISFLSLFSGDSSTSAGFIRDSSGLIYQNVSYYSAHAFGLTLFHISESKRLNPLSWFYKIICFILLVIQTSTCFLSGGRGGLVLLAVLLIANVLINFGKKSYKIVVPGAIFVIVTRYTVPWLIGLLNINIKGLNRIMKFLNSSIIDDGRTSLYIKSLELFNENPIKGKGIGSVFFYMQGYSHNLFIDILIETGILGLSVFIIFLIWYLLKNISLFQQGSLFRFLTIIFICGITFNMFSGYFWVNPHIWLPLAVVLTINNKDLKHSVVESKPDDTDSHDNEHLLEDEDNG